MWPWRRKKHAPTLPLDEISRSFHAHKLAIEQLQEDVAALRKQHETLRGRFYASGAHKGAGEAVPQSKAEVLRAAGFVPGRPFAHKD